jgi:hypothetical protein
VRNIAASVPAMASQATVSLPRRATVDRMVCRI